MMQKTKCRRLITTHRTLGPLINGIQTDFASHATETSKLQIDEFPALKDLYPALVRGSPNEAFVPFPSPVSRPSENDILYYLHSSGSTGFPKPIPITNLTAVHWCISGKSLKQSAQPKKILKWCGISMHVRTHRVPHSNSDRCCILAIVPHVGHICSASDTHHLLEQCVHLPTNIFTRPLGGTSNTQLAQYPRLCGQDEIERFGGRASLPGAMGVFAQRN
jgi:hypothetical protein